MQGAAPAGWSRVSRASRWLLVLAGVLLLALLALALAGARFYERELLRRARTVELPAVVATMRSQMELQIRLPLLLSETIAHNQYLLDWEAAGLPRSGQQQWIAYARRLKQQTGADFVFWVSASHGQYFNENGFLRRVDEAAQPDDWLRRLLVHPDPWLLNINPGEIGGGTLLYVNYRFDTGRGQRGAAGVGINLRTLAERLRRYRIGQTGHVYLLSDSGQYLVHRDMERVRLKRRIQEDPDRALLAAALRQPRDYIQLDGPGEGGPTLYGASWLPQVRAWVVAEVPEHEITGSIERQVRRFSLLALACGVLLLVLFRGVWRVQVRSLRYGMREGQAVQQKLQHEQALKQAAFASISDGLINLDERGHISAVNSAACSLLGRLEPELLGKPLDMVLLVEPEPQPDPAVRRRFPALRPVRHQGEHYFEHTLLTLVDARGEHTGDLLLFRDVTHEHERQEQLLHQARHDPLTGLANRHRLLEYVQQLQQADPQRSLALLLIDAGLDERDERRLGHVGVDDVLLEIASRLRSQVKEGALACRTGGKDFIVVLPRPSSELEVQYFGECLLQSLQAPLTAAGVDILPQPAIGIAFLPQHASEVDGLIAAADRAVLQQHRTGQPGVRLADNPAAG